MQYVSPLIREDFEAVNRMVVAKLHSDVPLVENIGHYIVEGGGKRLRPLICLLSARALGYPGADHVALATAIEFLHTATLLHDDVVDVSALRRGRATANANWGNAPSVLVGDFIYSRAFQLLVELGSLPILQLFAHTTNVIAEGEVEQLARIGDASISEAQYLQVIRKKTAVLFAAAAQGAGMLAGCGSSVMGALHDYGLNLGLAFQLIDDVLDYSGDPQLMGKNVGDDLAEGKLTLPLIHTLAHAERAAADRVREAIVARGQADCAAIARVVADSGALDYARRLADGHRLIALQCLDAIPDSGYRQSLADIANVSVNRHA